jgi:Ca2+-binding EF-hand superfamily protein
MRLAFLVFWSLSLCLSIPFDAKAAADPVLGTLFTGRDQSAGMARIRESLIATFRLKDVNSDGRVTLTEYLANAAEVFLEMEGAVRGVATLPEVQLYRCGKPMGGRGATSQGHAPGGPAFFRAMDANGNGAVDQPECRAFWAAEFARMDQSRDGRLMPGEYRDYARAIFERMDANKDGVLTLDEFLAAQIGPGN